MGRRPCHLCYFCCRRLWRCAELNSVSTYSGIGAGRCSSSTRGRSSSSCCCCWFYCEVVNARFAWPSARSSFRRMGGFMESYPSYPQDQRHPSSVIRWWQASSSDMADDLLPSASWSSTCALATRRKSCWSCGRVARSCQTPPFRSFAHSSKQPKEASRRGRFFCSKYFVAFAWKRGTPHTH
jgi:hypothetical protein